MDVKSAASHALQGNRAATRVENSASEKQNRHQLSKGKPVESEENVICEETPVMLSISAAGLRRSMLLERQEAQKEKAFSHEKFFEEMSKKMEGLSSQVINGRFSVSDRLNFHNEMKCLTEELDKLKDEKVSATQNDCSQLAQKISNFSKIVNEAALYRRSQTAKFIVTNKLQIEEIKHTFEYAV